ncbi:MAG: HAMP domain-containing protein [Desulfobacteraceae bacterium]|nr:MAG: HAMP domain-containing protein [Desulfobacteraceae bacterium]
MRNPGIHVRILLAAFLLISATTFSLGYIGANIAHQFAQKRFVEHISFLAKYLALTAELGILIDDRAMLHRLAVNLMSEKDVVGVAILDRHDQELIKIPEAVSGPFHIMETPVLLTESWEESKAFEYNEESEGSLIGKVRIIYSTEGIDQLWATMATYFIWLAGGLTCLAVLIFYFISRSLVAPVKELAQAARRVTQGDLNLRALPGSLPETRELAMVFNVMLDSLERNRKSLEEANEQMRRQKTLAEMGKFSMIIAHEFKNPLSIIKSSVDVLKKDFALSSDNTMIFYIEDEIMRLNRLIGDFLTFARPVAPSFRRTDLNDLLREIVTRFELQKNGTPCEIRSHIPSDPCYARVDPDLLIRAIGNVIKNAFESNEDKCVVQVKAARLADAWTIEIADDGEGIAPENIDKIFNPFFTMRAKGAGLGLAYASQAIMAHGGVISAENRMEGGALFRVEIPVT